METWIENSFGFEIESNKPFINRSEQSLLVKMVDVRTHDSLYIHIQKMANTDNLKVKVMTEEIEMAADVVQDLAINLGLDELASTASFTRMGDKLKEITETVE